MADQWLGSLVTDNAQAGFDLAIMMARMGVKYTNHPMRFAESFALFTHRMPMR